MILSPRNGKSATAINENSPHIPTTSPEYIMDQNINTNEANPQDYNPLPSHHEDIHMYQTEQNPELGICSEHDQPSSDPQAATPQHEQYSTDPQLQEAYLSSSHSSHGITSVATNFENSTISSAHSMIDRNQHRASREDVLRRLSDALLRRSLTMIDLSQRGLQPSDARLVKLALLQNESLSVLKLGYNNLCDEGITTLATGIQNHTALTSLDLGFNNFGDEGCKALASAIAANIQNGGKIHTLYLAGNRITGTGVRYLSQIFHVKTQSSVGLKRLHLTGNKIGSEGIQDLVEAMIESGTNNSVESPENDINFSANGGVEEIFLGETGLGHAGILSINKLLACTKTLKVLSLSNCELGDESIMVLASTLSENSSHLPLERLQLSFNKLTWRGIEALMNGVWGLKCLKELQIDNNRMEGRGAQVVSATVAQLKTLEKLDVGFNLISANGMKLLMKAVADSRSLTSISMSGNNVDINSAKAIAYALAHNTSLKSIFLDHCCIPKDGQRHIAAGIVSNSRTALEILTGFPVGLNAVTLGLPASLETWSNEQVLKFIRYMWEQRQKEQEEKSMNGAVDPLHMLDGDIPQPNAPLDPPTVVGVAKRAFESLSMSGDSALLQSLRQRSVSSDSPLTEDAVIMEANGILLSAADIDGNTSSSSFKEDGDKETLRSKTPPIPNSLMLQSPESSDFELDTATKKKRIVQWLCKNIHHLNELAQLPFNSSELWRLHQHFFSPTIQMTIRNEEDITDSLHSFESSASRPASAILSAPCAKTLNANAPTIPSSEPVIHGRKSLLKRKVSYRFLGEATLSSNTLVDMSDNKKDMDESVSKLIENMNGQSMEPKSKRARRNRSRISIVPRLKEKLDSYLDCDHQKALGLMRQIFYVEKSLLNSSIYPVDEKEARTHLIGSLAADCETILLEMM